MVDFTTYEFTGTNNNPNKQMSLTKWNAFVETVREGSPVATRVELAAAETLAGRTRFLTEDGREGVFKFSSSDLSTRVAADANEALYVAPDSDATGASGAWVRQFDSKVFAKWWGWDEDNAAAVNDAAVAAMFVTLKALRYNLQASSASLYDVDLGYGTYQISAPITPTGGAVDIYGHGSGHGTGDNTSGTTKIVANDCTAFLIQDDSGISLGGTSINNLAIEGTFDGTEAEYHGIHATTQYTRRDVKVRNMAGDAFHTVASTGASTNANNSYAVNCDAWGCRDGIVQSGNNTNACVFIGGRSRSHRRWAINEQSSLGNLYLMVSLGTNAVEAENDGVTIGAAEVSYSGNRYGAIPGQEAGASTNAPSGTTADNTWWYYIEAGAATTGVPEWTSGILVRAGGAVYAPDLNAKNLFLCYGENGGPKSHIAQGGLVLGGYLAGWCYQNPAVNMGTSILQNGTDGKVNIAPALDVPSGTVTTTLGGGRGNTNLLAARFTDSVYAPSSMTFRFSANGNLLLTQGTGGNEGNALALFGTPTSTSQFGTGAAVTDASYVKRLMLGDSVANGRQITNGTAAPASDAHGQGEIVIKRDPASAADPVFYRCRVAGTPGTWDTYYALTAAPGSAAYAETTDFQADDHDHWTYVKLGSDFTTGSATAVDVTGLAFTPAASTRYEFEGVFRMRTTTATVGAKPGMSWPTGHVDGVAEIVAAQNRTAAGSAFGNPDDGAMLAAPTGLPNTNQSWPAFVKGEIEMGASPSGNIQIQLASETAATDVTMKAGSYIRYRVIP